MTIYRCDKCHREQAHERDLQRVTIHPAGLPVIRELCQRCVVELSRWLEPDPIVVQDPR